MNPRPSGNEVIIVSVCFNSSGVLPAMLASAPPGVPVVLVDNASADAAAIEKIAAAHGAQLIRNTRNRGFGAACNQGAAAADSEFILFLNPDATLAPGAVEALVGAAARYPKAVAMNPRIEDGRSRPRFKHYSVLLPFAARLPRGWPPADCEVPVLTGSALFVRRADFEAVGGFDPAIFLFHEDDDLSLRLKDERGPLMFIRDALVRHQGGRSSARSPEVAALKAWHMGQSRVYAARKHGRPLAFSRALASALAQAASPFAWFSRRKRAKQLAFLKGVMKYRG